MADWPTTLPAPRVAAYSAQAEDPNVRTQMESGPDLVRGVNSAPVDKHQFSLRLSDWQYQVFSYFVRVTLNFGRDWFDGFPLNEGAVTSQQVRISQPSQRGLDSQTRHLVTFGVEVRDPYIIAPDTYALLSTYDLTGIERAAARAANYFEGYT